MELLLLLMHVSLLIWVLFFGGAESLEGSMATLLFFLPAMTSKELKFFASLSLVGIPFYFL